MSKDTVWSTSMIIGAIYSSIGNLANDFATLFIGIVFFTLALIVSLITPHQ